MFTGLRHNMVESATTLVTQFCDLFNMPALFGNLVSCEYTPPDSANFNGTSDYIGWNPSPYGASINQLTWIARIKRNQLATLEYLVSNTSDAIRFRINASNIPEIRLENSANVLRINKAGDNAITSQDSQVWFISADGQNGLLSFYIDDINQVAGYSYNSTGAIGADLDPFNFGASFVPSLWFSGCYGPFLFCDQYVDWSVLANRRNVIDATGALQDPGNDGSNWLPTGHDAPEIFINDTYNNPGVNSGTAGNPTTVPVSPSICT